MLVLGIESSCDETGVALVGDLADGTLRVVGDALFSQVDMHRAYGGVVPELASRDHIQRALPLLSEALSQSGRSLIEIDAIAVTQGPGLGGALLVGAGIAAGLATALEKPLIPIHHLEGHLLSPMLASPAPAFPFVALLVSGGHTQLMAVDGVGKYRLLGETIDDAAGEAFDKSASLLGLGYPGGAALSKLALQGNPDRFKLPRPMLQSDNLDFSFSGLKTAVAQLTAKQRNPDGALTDAQRADIAAGFEAAVVDVLVQKSLRALKQHGLERLVVAGGVGANQRLRAQLTARVRSGGGDVFYPPLSLCTDNGAMIALAAAMRLKHGLVDSPQTKNSALGDPLGGALRGAPEANFNGAFNVRPRWPLSEVA
jgi:N6-L-threonylcarbamoyladenine synthase